VISRNRQSGSVSYALKEYARAGHFEGETAARSVIAENTLAEAKAIAADRHDLKATFISRIGDPADEILACARQFLSDVILLGRRGRGPRRKPLTEGGELGRLPRDDHAERRITTALPVCALSQRLCHGYCV
jgi:nucleotide-binding universal stress UspA family protein